MTESTKSNEPINQPGTRGMKCDYCDMWFKGENQNTDRLFHELTHEEFQIKTKQWLTLRRNGND